MAKVHIREEVAAARPAFHDRREAGVELSRFIGREERGNALVLGLPRGGVPVGEGLAAALGAPLEVVAVRKLPLPRSPEMGFGAVTIDGTFVLNEEVVRAFGLDRGTIDSVAEEVEEEVRRRAGEYGAAAGAPEVEGREVYLVDDGLATGYTMLAAAKMVSGRSPASMSLAVPVSPRRSLDEVAPLFDEAFVLIVQDGGPFAVASFYERFGDLSDEEVREALRRANEGRLR